MLVLIIINEDSNNTYYDNNNIIIRLCYLEVREIELQKKYFTYYMSGYPIWVLSIQLISKYY